MASDLLDLEALLAPLESGDQGVGVDLRDDYSATSAYQRLRDARSAARAEERARDAEGDSDGVEAAGWREVVAVGVQALASQTKDVEIAAWVTEALVRSDGIQGAAAGARLIAGLCETFWEPMFPQPDEDGLEGRSSPIGGLSGASADGTIMQPLRRWPLFRRADGTGVGVYQWDQSEQVETLDEARREARYAAGTPKLSALEAESRLDKAYISAVRREVVDAIEAWTALDKVLDARFGADAPSLRNVNTLLSRMLEIITRLGGVEEAPPDEVVTTAGAGQPSAAGGASGPAGDGGALNRESALRELDRIAEYFRRTEPHSPLAYTLDEAVRRGRMTLPELLAEVVPDVEARNGMLMRLGIKPPEPE